MRIVEVYEFLDGPRLFLREHGIDLYLMYWCDVTNQYGTRFDGYLCTHILPNKLEMLRNQLISYRDVFKSAERGCTILYTNGNSVYDIIVAGAAVGDEYYPPEGYFVEHITEMS